MPNIRISEQSKEIMDKIKERNGHTTHDSVLRYLFHEAGEPKKEVKK